MTDKELAEAYYAVADHLSLNGRSMIATAKQLLSIADRMSDEISAKRMAQQPEQPETQEVKHE